MFRRVRLLVAAVVIVAALGVGTVAQAADSFRFYGSGYGHGIGMSQWGAYGLANKGWSYRQILTHFYSRTKVVESSTLPKKIRVGLTSGRTTIHLKREERSGPPVAGRSRRHVRREDPLGEDLDGVGRLGREQVRDPRRHRRAGRGAPVGRTRPGLCSPRSPTPAPGSSCPRRTRSGIEGYTYAYGFLEFDLFGCADRCAERLTIELPFERYLRGMGEMPSSWPGAALRSQAVAARTFATYKIRRYGLRSDCDCHLADGAGDQVYVGWSKEIGPDGNRWVAAVTDTAGEIVTYGGSVIQAFYAASDGGYSEDIEDVWHGGNPAYAIPYLRGVCDPGRVHLGESVDGLDEELHGLEPVIAPVALYGRDRHDLSIHRRPARGLGSDRERDRSRDRRLRLRRRQRAQGRARVCPTGGSGSTATATSSVRSVRNTTP